MNTPKNWFIQATAAEQAGGQQLSGGQTSSQSFGQGQVSAKAPAPTPSTAQRSQQQQNQRNNINQISQMVVPDVANKALPSLNQSLHMLTNAFSTRGDFQATPEMARGLAIEVMAAWIAECRKNGSGGVSELGSVVAKSQRILAVLTSK